MFEMPQNAVTEWIKYQNSENVFVPVSIDLSCPYCHRTPINFPFPKWDYRVDSLFAQSRCPGCGESSRFWIVGQPKRNKNDAIAGSRIFMLPEPLFHQPFDQGIQEISPMFVKIYSQAAKAESTGLDALNGVGYRKALEFLIKDFASRSNPDKAENIQKISLAQCIREYVDDVKVKEVAARATWLGNDETHYVRKWLDKDVEDLKVLLQLTIYWISSSLLTERYISSMSSGKS